MVENKLSDISNDYIDYLKNNISPNERVFQNYIQKFKATHLWYLKCLEFCAKIQSCDYNTNNKYGLKLITSTRGRQCSRLQCRKGSFFSKDKM